MNRRVLLVEDDDALRKGLRFNLEQDGYDVEVAGSGADALARVATFDPHLILLDLNLPDMDGLDVLAQLRSGGDDRAVLCLTARGQETDVVMGLGKGADDYVTKPFGLAELRARVEALLRRATAQSADTATSNEVVLGDARVDLSRRRVFHADREEELTPTETEVLVYLLDRRDQVVERAQILADLWGLRRPGSTRTLDNHMARLRRKLEADPSHPRVLLTVHGAGYRLAGTTS